MSGALAVLLAVLKLLGGVLLLLLALVLLLLCVRATLAGEYRPDALSASVRYGPVRIALYPRPQKRQKPAKAGRKAKPAAEKRPPQKPAKAAKTKKAAPAQKDGARPALAQRFIAALKEDPAGLLGALLGHLAFAGGRLLRGIHVRHLRVYWTVTAEGDAAATAIQYGAQMALLNNLLARARQLMEIEADSLRLEPDFTGEKMPQRGISGEVSFRPIVAVVLLPRLLFRLWRDPAFKTILH